jgi:hypothetical protein
MSKATNYGNSKCQEAVWNKAAEVKGKDSDLYRRDSYGNVIYKHSYGKNSNMGWQIDHIKPQSKQGSDCLRNLQALKTSVNYKLSNKTVKRSRH